MDGQQNQSKETPHLKKPVTYRILQTRHYPRSLRGDALLE